MKPRRIAIAAGCILTVLPAASSTAAPLDAAPPLFGQSASTIDELLELGRPVVLAHTGGEAAYPGSTMYAFGRSMETGVDMLDLNVVLTADGVLAVQHDLDVDRLTDGTGLVADLTFAELNALDNAYWFTEDCGECHDAPEVDFIFRGVRTGDVTPPEGFGSDDFAVPRLEDVMDAYPDIPLGIEVKETGDAGFAAVDTLVALLRERDRIDAVVVSSFQDDVIAHVQNIAPELAVSPGPGAIGAFILDGTPLPGDQRIFQLPPEFAHTALLTAENIAAAHEAGYVIWVWPNDRALETRDAYGDFLLDGIDGLNIDFPADGVAAVEQFVAAASPAE